MRFEVITRMGTREVINVPFNSLYEIHNDHSSR